MGKGNALSHTFFFKPNRFGMVIQPVYVKFQKHIALIVVFFQNLFHLFEIYNPFSKRNSIDDVSSRIQFHNIIFKMYAFGISSQYPDSLLRLC